MDENLYTICCIAIPDEEELEEDENLYTLYCTECGQPTDPDGFSDEDVCPDCLGGGREL